MNEPISEGVSSALPRAFSRRFAILKIVEEKTLGTRLIAVYTECKYGGPSHESEAKQSSMFCYDNVSPRKSCFVVDLGCFCLALPISFCVPECHQKEVKSSTAEKVYFFLRFAVASEEKQTKERSSRSPKELGKFVQAERS